jgi:hypothetical protein
MRGLGGDDLFSSLDPLLRQLCAVRSIGVARLAAKARSHGPSCASGQFAPARFARSLDMTVERKRFGTLENQGDLGARRMPSHYAVDRRQFVNFDLAAGGARRRTEPVRESGDVHEGRVTSRDGRVDGTVRSPDDSMHVCRRPRRFRPAARSSIIPFNEADRWNLHMPGLCSPRSAPRSLKQLRRQVRDIDARRPDRLIRANLATFPRISRHGASA